MGDLITARFDRGLTLRDGTRVRMRPIRPDDAPRLVAAYDRLSRDTRYQRFFSVMRRLPPDWARFLATVDGARRFALVVEAPGDPDTLIAVARYEPAAEPDTAEVAFVVQDAWQGHGLATALLHELAAYARAHGVERFLALTMGTNVRMLDVLHNCGFPCHTRYDGGDIIATLDITAPPRFPPWTPASGDIAAH
jgi:RimJ/RimL family protein N-acetyltransferase